MVQKSKKCIQFDKIINLLEQKIKLNFTIL